MKVLMTGAAGFLGRELADVLEKGGHELKLVDRVEKDDATIFVPGSADRKRVPLVTKWPYIKAEVVDELAMRNAMEGCDAVIHLAARTDGLPQNGKSIMEANVIGTYVPIDQARQVGVKRFLCASSINAFGTIYWKLSGKPAEYKTMPLNETFEVVPEDPYSLSKYVNELTCATFHRAYGMTTAAFRFAGVWTKEQYESFVSKPMNKTEAWSDDLFQWVHMTDIAEGIKKCLECPTLPGFGAYTLGAADTRCPEPTMELLAKFGPHLKVTEPLPGRTPLMSIRKAQEAFGYSPRFRVGP